jgi:hypothetical protein
MHWRVIACWLTACLPALAVAAGVPGQGTWERTLKPRDLDGNGQIDAFYDTVLDVTWLRDADVNGIMFLPDAQTWAANLEFGGYTDWRLPTMVDTGERGCDWAYGGTDCGYNVQTGNRRRVFSEMAHLFDVTLGNTSYCNTAGECDQPGWGLSNTGDFVNLHEYFYWIGTPYGPGGVFGWYYYTPTIYQAYGVKTLGMYAMAVRDGDVAPTQVTVVPEPATGLLMPLGLGGLTAARGRRS